MVNLSDIVRIGSKPWMMLYEIFDNWAHYSRNRTSWRYPIIERLK